MTTQDSMRERSTQMHRVRNVHFVGIGGVGMAGIAEVLVNENFSVTGSDQKESAAVERLRELGAKISIGHDAGHVQKADVLVVSTAIAADNPEVLEARAGRIPVIRRAEMLAELMRLRFGIAVAGTHGKTTTTSLVASVLAEGNLDPTFVVGGKVNSAGTNARLGAGRYIVVEADESDASFLHLTPTIAVVTNIDADHMSTYDGDFEKLKDTFIEFLHDLPFYGLAVICLDDPVCAEVMDRIARPVSTYGIESDAEVVARNIEPAKQGCRFKVAFKDGTPEFSVHLNLPGRHNVLNALAAIAVGRELGVSSEAMQKSLSTFMGIGRRFEIQGEVLLPQGSVLLVDDYGHHPREVAATVTAAKETWPDRRLVVAFQPHRYSRTRDLLDDFVQVLSQCPCLLVTEVYPAGEQPISNADGRALCRGVRATGAVEPVFVENVQDLPVALARVIQDGDVVLTLGAGDIGSVAGSLKQSLLEVAL